MGFIRKNYEIPDLGIAIPSAYTKIASGALNYLDKTK